MKRRAAANTVMTAFVVVLVILGFVLLPNALQHILDWKTSTEKYLLGGVAFLDRSLRGLEHAFPYFAHAHIADNANAKLTELTGNAQQYLQPVVVGLAAWTPSLVLTPFLAFFFLRHAARRQH